MSDYYHLHTKLSSEFILICAYQNLLSKSHPSQSLTNYFVNIHLGISKSFLIV